MAWASWAVLHFRYCWLGGVLGPSCIFDIVGSAGSPEGSVFRVAPGTPKCYHTAIGVTTSDNAIWEHFGAGLLGPHAFLILSARRDPETQRVLCFGLSLEPKSATTQPLV